MDAGILECGLDVFEEVLGLEHFRMAPVQPARGDLLRSDPTRTLTSLQRRLEGLVVAEAASTERLLDRVMEVVALELRDPSGAVAPHARQPQDLSFAHAGAEEHRDDLEEAQVLLSHVLVGRRARQPEGDVEAFEHREGDVDLVAQLGEGPVRTRWTSTPELDVPEGQIT